MDPACQHNNYTLKFIKSDDTDVYHFICKLCNKILGKRIECISMNWNDFFDKEWANRLKVEETYPEGN